MGRKKKQTIEIVKTDPVFIKTSDDWYPNYPGDEVRVSMSFVKKKNEQNNVVCVWGADDCGMEFWSPDRELVRSKYREICSWDNVTFEKLEKLGLYPA
jgi:hypothetical protein